MSEKILPIGLVLVGLSVAAWLLFHGGESKEGTGAPAQMSTPGMVCTCYPAPLPVMPLPHEVSP